jgi:putative membrane protein
MEFRSAHLQPGLRRFATRWAITTMAVLVAANIVPGIHYQSLTALLVASLLLGVFNAVLRPLLLILSFPLVVFSLGLFTLVINAVLLYFVGQLVKSFHVDTFGSALIGGLIISIVSIVLNIVAGTSDGGLQFRRVQFPDRTSTPRPGPDRTPGGSGPIIDV